MNASELLSHELVDIPLGEMGGWELFLWGAIGGFLGEALLLAPYRSTEAMPVHWRTVRYWLFAAFWVLTGGLLAYIQGQGASLSVLIAVQLGLTAPLGLTQLARVTPDPPVGSVG